ncbi:putative beta-glucosidase D [Cytospora mali]|uniref:beta-glucosidase n=1 Tax=Cytospora mali TaxID=578113 RepID=A0A194VKA3_CYTMA|nr:putative beta-glucosidase D [Valsa mali]
MARLSLLLASALYLFGQNAAATNSSSNYNTTSLLSSGYLKLGDWQDAYDKSKALLDSLTTAEKLSIVCAGDGGNFSSLYFKDSSSTVLYEYYVTTWPASLSLAHSWNKSLVYEHGGALATEHKARGVNAVNCPTSQPLGRNPWGGRLGETFGPDSYLNGQMTGLQAKAIFDKGLIPSGKHFLLNEQETNRDAGNGGLSSKSTLTKPYSANADDKTAHETYLFSFYDAVKNGMGGIMCAMNQVNNSYSCENQGLLLNLLKTEIGFPGLVLPDVGAQYTAYGSFNGGLDYGSSQYWSNETITEGLANGTITMDRLDDMVIRNVISYYRLNQDVDYPSQAETGEYITPDPRKGHAALAREFAANSLVLLKNNKNALPLSSPKKVAIFGWHAGSPTMGPNTPLDVQGNEPAVFQGHMAQVGGSGQASFSYLVTPHYAFTTKAIEDGTMLRYMLNDSIITSSSSFMKRQDMGSNSTGGGGPGGGPPGGGGGGGGGSSYSDTTAAEQTTLSYAYNQDACVVFANAFSGEGGDRSELHNTEQDALVNEVASNCNNTIVVINTTGPRLVDGFIENENVTAVVYGGALGEQSGNAIIDVLYGTVNPSGKLAHTLAKNESDYNVETSYLAQINFTEGNYVDYKYFDKYNVTPRYEFGYGLSYTTFEYSSEVSVTSNATAGYAAGAHAIGGREDLWDNVATVTASVTNTGKLDGAEVAQLYIAFPEAADMPVRNLRGFDKVFIPAGETETVTFELRKRDLAHWDVDAQEWKVEAGDYTLYVGASSRDLKAQATLTV